MSYKKRFKVSTTETKMWFWVIVYDTQAQMQAEARRYDELQGKAKLEGNLLGTVQPYERFIVREGKRNKRHDNIGVIRLTKEYLQTEVVSHEVLHAALWNYRLKYGKANFGKQCSEDEEDLAYIYGKLFTSMTRKLYKHKFWS